MGRRRRGGVRIRRAAGRHAHDRRGDARLGRRIRRAGGGDDAQPHPGVALRLQQRPRRRARSSTRTNSPPYLLVVLALAAGVAFYGRGPALRALAAVTLIVGLAALAETYSRWGFLAAIAGDGVFRPRGPRSPQLDRVRCRRDLALAVVAGPVATHHNPRDDTSRVRRLDDGTADLAGLSLTGSRSVPIPAHLRCPAAARSAGRGSAGGVRPA